MNTNEHELGGATTLPDRERSPLAARAHATVCCLESMPSLQQRAADGDRPPSNPATSHCESDSASRRAWKFVRAFVREPMKVGAIWPSSDQLSHAVADACDFAPGDTVIELGPGTGNFTALLANRLDRTGRLVAVELCEPNVRMLKQRFPTGEIIFDSAEHLSKYVKPGTAQCVVSGLAWGNMLPAMQNRIMDAVLTALAPGGEFVGFSYVHARAYPTIMRFRKLMQTRFARFETTPIIWRNVPPAYVYRCIKGN